MVEKYVNQFSLVDSKSMHIVFLHSLRILSGI